MTPPVSSPALTKSDSTCLLPRGQSCIIHIYLHASRTVTPRVSGCQPRLRASCYQRSSTGIWSRSELHPSPESLARTAAGAQRANCVCNPQQDHYPSRGSGVSSAPCPSPPSLRIGSKIQSPSQITSDSDCHVRLVNVLFWQNAHTEPLLRAGEIPVARNTRVTA